DDRAADPGRGGRGPRRVDLDGAAAVGARRQADRRAGPARSRPDAALRGGRGVSGRDDEALIAALSEAARRVAKAEAAGEPAPGAWHRLEARRARQRGGQRDGRRWSARVALVAAACAVVGAGTIAGLRLRSGRALTYDVGGGAIAESGYIRGAHDRAAAVRFSDGTRIDLGAGARMSVAAPGPHGARLRLEEGEAHFAVMHLPHAAWTVEAGPYTVEVIGTVFDVRWSSAEEVVEVRLQTGAVRVSGPLLAEHATLRSGQHLTARLATRELRIDENAAAPAAPPLTVPPPGRTPHAPAAAVVYPPRRQRPLPRRRPRPPPRRRTPRCPSGPRRLPAPGRPPARSRSPSPKRHPSRPRSGRCACRRATPRASSTRRWRAGSTTWSSTPTGRRWWRSPTPPATPGGSTWPSGCCARSGPASLARRPPRAPPSSWDAWPTIGAPPRRASTGTGAISTRRRGDRTPRRRSAAPCWPWRTSRAARPRARWHWNISSGSPTGPTCSTLRLSFKVRDRGRPLGRVDAGRHRRRPRAAGAPRPACRRRSRRDDRGRRAGARARGGGGAAGRRRRPRRGEHAHPRRAGRERDRQHRDRLPARQSGRRRGVPAGGGHGDHLARARERRRGDRRPAHLARRAGAAPARAGLFARRRRRSRRAGRARGRAAPRSAAERAPARARGTGQRRRGAQTVRPGAAACPASPLEARARRRRARLAPASKRRAGARDRALGGLSPPAAHVRLPHGGRTVQ